MALQFLNNIDINHNEIRNMKIERVSTLPSSDSEGRIVWHTDLKRYYISDGTDWLPLATHGYVGDETGDVLAALTDHENETTELNNPHDSKTYVDGEITTLDTNLSGDISDVQSNLDDHTDKIVDDVNNPHNIKQYTEGEINTAKTEMESYADTAANDAETNANLYTDGEISTLNTNLSSDISAVQTDVDNHKDAAAPHSNHEVITKRGSADGYAPLDANALIPNSHLPEQARMKLHIVDNDTERDNLSTGWDDTETGNKAVVLDSGNTYIWDGTMWVLQSEDIWGEVNVLWENIENKPLSTVTEIDDAVSFTQSSDLFNNAGDYTNLRARATTKDDVGLGDVDNYSQAHYDSRYLQRSNNLSDVLDVDAAKSNLSLDLVTDKRIEVIGDGTSTTFTFNNPFPETVPNELMIQVIENTGSYANVFPSVNRDNTNDNIIIEFSEAPDNEAYRVIMIG